MTIAISMGGFGQPASTNQNSNKIELNLPELKEKSWKGLLEYLSGDEKSMDTMIDAVDEDPALGDALKQLHNDLFKLGQSIVDDDGDDFKENMELFHAKYSPGRLSKKDIFSMGKTCLFPSRLKKLDILHEFYPELYDIEHVSKVEGDAKAGKFKDSIELKEIEYTIHFRDVSATCGFPEVISYWLKKDQKAVTCCTLSQYNALKLVFDSGHPEILKECIDAGFNINMNRPVQELYEFFKTGRHEPGSFFIDSVLSAENKPEDIRSIDIMIEAGADLNRLDRIKNNALMTAVEYNKGFLVEKLFNGVDLFVENRMDKNALDIAKLHTEEQLNGQRKAKFQVFVDMLEEQKEEMRLKIEKESKEKGQPFPEKNWEKILEAMEKEKKRKDPGEYDLNILPLVEKMYEGKNPEDSRVWMEKHRPNEVVYENKFEIDLDI